MGVRPALPDSTTDAFVAEALAAANAYRDKHHAPPLTVDPELTEYAKSRAASRSEFKELDAGHTGLRDQTGENIYWGVETEAPAKGSAAVDEWYGEVKYYDFNKAEFTPQSGHFTQLVWKASTKVGIGRVSGQTSEGLETYIVFVFEPRGNMKGSFAANVLPA
ncbi:CAP family protein [Nonomuraea gerenzanensis]|nr:CAP family protein [Nonomuraea gerenzanensis]UBU13065.1 CAP family protein [Nonomuraea gerenzanensis]